MYSSTACYLSIHVYKGNSQPLISSCSITVIHELKLTNIHNLIQTFPPPLLLLSVVSLVQQLTEVFVTLCRYRKKILRILRCDDLMVFSPLHFSKFSKLQCLQHFEIQNVVHIIFHIINCKLNVYLMIYLHICAVLNYILK